ncbi:MAG: CPBP family intramembrane metalloprotease [Chloroflexi bacterium]|nr:CPBP family intramembrane metalloprotease [Chloroflexota bacterium]
MNRVPAATLLPLVLLLAGAAVESMRLPALVLLLAGLVASLVHRRRGPEEGTSRAVLVWAGCLAVALNMAWTGVPLPAFARDLACADRFAPFAALRIIGAVVMLGAVAVLVRIVRADPADLGLRWPSRPWLLTSLAGLPVIAVAAILLGPILAKPFFGPVSPMPRDLGSLIPALAFAVANASMEEVAYRGALLRWLTPVTGTATALALQALVFGLAHGTGTDFTGSPLPVMAATAAAGLILGAMALRTRSLLLPIAIHVALDIPVFYGKVCLGL